MQSLELKIDQCWCYYGSADAIELFESFGTSGEVAVLAEILRSTVSADSQIAAVEEAFKNAGYMITTTQKPDGTMLTLIMPGKDALIAGKGNDEWVGMMSSAMRVSAEAQDIELKINKGWFCFGFVEAMDLIESII